MGLSQSLSHCNIHAMAQITQAKCSDIERLLEVYLEDLEWERTHPNGPDSDYDSDDSIPEGVRQHGRVPIPKGDPLPNIGLTEEEQEGDNVEFVDRSYPCHPDHIKDICEFLKFEKGDIDVLLNIYTTMDEKGTNNASVRDVVCAFLPICSANVGECVRTACTLFDLDNTETVGYGVLLHIFTLLMRGFSYFGDKVVDRQHTKDVVDSIFTMEGKTEGFIAFDQYMLYIEQHPVVVLLSSQQFQGLARKKFLDLNQYEADLRNVNERPMWREQLLLKEHRIEEGIDSDPEDKEDDEVEESVGARVQV